MQRRDFLGSMLAVFTGLALPAPVREAISTHTVWPADVMFFGGARGGGKRDAFEAVFRQYYQLGITPRNRAILKGIVEPTESVRVSGGLDVTSLGAAPPGTWVSLPAAAGVWA